MQVLLNNKSKKERSQFQPSKRQSGVSFFGFLIVGAIVIGLALLGMQVFPSVNEYMAVTRAVKKAALEGGESPAEIRRKFDKNAEVADITSIKGTDLDISKEGSDVTIGFHYEKKIPIAGPMSLVIDFAGKSVGGK